MFFALVAFLPVSLMAQSVSIWDGTSEIWTQGSGTEANPYLIQNAQQLAYIAEMVNGGVTHYEDTYFKLTTNVLIDSTTAWEPIGLNSTYYFSGHFDGDNHLVTLYLTTSTLQYSGIFGYAQNGGIFNLGSAGRVTRTANSLVSYAGGICGYSASAINNCHNTGNITSNVNSDKSYAGGICGYSSAATTNCHNIGDISSFSSGTSVSTPSYSGGICGYSSATVTNSYNTGNVSTSISDRNYSNPHSGGICGLSSATVANCHNTGHVSSTTSSVYSPFSGGICGYSRSATVSNCYNTGAVSAIITTRRDHSFSGGICGYVYNTGYAKIANCYNTGNVSSTLTSPSSGLHAYSGGISAYGYSTITNCYNVGSLLSGDIKGGIYGDGNSTITNCHYLNTCGHNASTGGTAKTEAQMKSSSFPVILNTDSVVFVKDITPNINQGYPVFGSVHTLAADSIGNSTATLHGDYQMLYDVDVHGFEYKKTSESNYTTVTTSGYSPVSKPLTGLQGGTQYTYRFFVQKDGIYYRGKDKTFNTVECTLTAQIASNSNTLCDGDTVIYTATATSSTPTTYQYVWSTGDSLNTISVTDGASYTVTVTDAYGCSATQTKQITLYPAAEAYIIGSTVLCNGGSTTLTANGGTYYSWNTGSAQRTITVTQPGTYIASVQTIYGCTASDTVVVTTFANPVINGNTVFCSGGYTTLTATGGENYLWSTGATTASINVNTEGTYSVTASTSNGCSGSASVMVIQNQASDVTISGNTVICSGIGTSLTVSSGTDYLWSTGETTQSINVNNPGSYSVTVTSNNGCSSSASQTVSLMEQPIISGNNHICSGQSTTLTTSGSGSYAWSNGASTSFITVNTPGTYSVTITLPNGCSSSATIDVSVGTMPTPSVSGNTTICEGDNSTLIANGGVSYVWSNGSTNNSINVAQSGIYTVTVTNAEGCSASTNVTITVNPLPNVNITGNSSFCQGDNTTLTATGASTYAWSNGSSNPAITVNNAGTYTVIGTDANGCTSTATQTISVNPTYNTPLTHSICEGENYNFYGQNLTTAGTYTHTLQTVNGCDSVLTLTLTVKSLPTPNITGNTTLCEGQTTTLTANGGVSYAWSNGSTNNSINVAQSGVYTVTATNVEGCSATAQVSVTVNPLPEVNISGNTTLCAGSSTTLTASGADTYQWSDGSTNASLIVNAFGIYSVTGTSSAGCTNTANVTVLVSQAPQITITGDTDICAGESTTLTANGGDTYLWSNGNTEPTLTVNTAGTWQVIGYNEAGCNAMASATVNVWQPTTSEFTITTNDPCYTWNDVEYCESGDYTQPLETIHGCDSVVTLHLTIGVGIDDYNGFNFKVYPNPTSNIVNVEFGMGNEELGNVEIRLYDVYGKLLNVVGTQCIASLQATLIDLSRYANGVYILKAVTDGKTITVRKVVKQ